MEIHKKIWPEFFKEVKSGNKTFEYRLADWQANEGDTLILEEWDPKTKTYTGQKVTKTIGYVLNLKDMPKFHGEEDQAKIEEFGHMIISLKD
jgi:ASC-1-like (ASCH) protein